MANRKTAKKLTQSVMMGFPMSLLTEIVIKGLSMLLTEPMIVGISIQNQRQADPRLHSFSNPLSILLALVVKIACMHACGNVILRACSDTTSRYYIIWIK